MQKIILSTLLSLLSYSGFASGSTSVSVNATSSGSTNATTTTAGTMTVTGGGSRGYAVFDLSTVVLPAGTSITGVSLTFSFTVSGSGTPVDSIFGYAGDISLLSAADQYAACHGDSVLYVATWGSVSRTLNLATTNQSRRFVQSFLSGKVSFGWIESSGARNYSISGAPAPYITISYSCNVPTSLSTSLSSTTVCNGSTVTLTGTATGATSYSWAGPGSFASSTQTNTLTATAASAGIYTMTAISVCGATATRTTSTLIVHNPPAAITGILTSCTGVSTTLADAVAGGTWSSSNGTKATIDNTTGVVHSVSGGTAVMKYTISGCPVASATFVVKAAPVTINGTKTICSGTSTTLSCSALSGSWSSSDSSIASINPSTGVMRGVSGGLANITYDNGCGYAVTQVKIKTVPAPIVGSSAVCVASTTSISDPTPFGIWSSSNTSKAKVDTNGVVLGISAGVVSIRYATGCGTTASYTMTVNALPAAIGGSNLICLGTTGTLSDATAAGVWSSSDPSSATINSAGVVTPVSQGNPIISYTKLGCVATKTLSVNTIPAPIGGPSIVCSGSTITLTNTAINGLWSSSSTGIATIDVVTGVVTPGATTGNSLMIYSTGCGSPVSALIHSTSVPLSITGSSLTCMGGSSILSNAVLGGTWTSSNPAVATVGYLSGLVSAVSPGVTNISYSTGCGADVTMSITAATTPSAITGADNVCGGTSTSLVNTAAYGTWISSDTTIAAIDPVNGTLTGLAQGYASITYSTGCGTDATTSILVKQTPTSIVGPSTMCLGTTSIMSNTAVAGTWSSSDPLVADVNPSTGEISTVITYGTGSTIISYGTGCGPDATQPLSVFAAPVAITGVGTLCSTATTTFSELSGGGSWSSTNNAVATVNPSTGVVSSVASGTATIVYSNGCGSDATHSITIETLPAAITGVTNVCGGTTTNLYDGVAGGVWSSSNTLVATVDASGVVSGITGGFSNISYTLTNSCGTNSVSVPVNVNSLGNWLGLNSNWNDPLNWACGVLPSATGDVVIPSGVVAPTVSSNINVNNLTLLSGALLNINDSIVLTVGGNLSNAGMIKGNGALTMTSNTAKVISHQGFVQNINLDNASGVSISSGDSVKVGGTLNLVRGTLNTNNGLILHSDSTVTGRIGQIPSGALINGIITVRQYFAGGHRAYRFFGHPFNNSLPLSQFRNQLDITGVGGATNGFTPTTTNAPSCYWYHTACGNSSLGSDPGWKAYTSCYGTPDTNNFKQYEGIRLFVRGKYGEGLDGAAYTPSPVTVSLHGVINMGNQTIVMHKGVTSDYNQLSNPYPSPVNLGAVLLNAKLTNQINGSAFYVWNPYLGVNGAFEVKTIGSAYVLEANSSFQVRAMNEGSTLTFTEANKAKQGDELLLRSASEFVTLNIYDADYHLWDMVNIDFTDKSTAGEDNTYDAGKAVNPDLNFYTISADKTMLSIDARPYSEGAIIPLGFTTNYAQDYIIKVANLKVPNNGTLYLHDKLTGTYTLLQDGAEYSFNVTSDAATQGNRRFELTTAATSVTEVTEKHLTVVMSPNPATDQVNINFTGNKIENASVRLLDITGVSVYNKNLGSMQSGSITVSLEKLPAGIYLAEVSVGDDHVVQRLIKE